LFIKNTKDYEDQVRQIFNEYHLKNTWQYIMNMLI
jgi:hypothetical protein